MINIDRQYKSFDIVLFLLVLAVAIFGVFAVESASMATYLDDLATKQKIFVALGVALIFLAAFVDYQFICRFFMSIYIVNLILLVIVLFSDPINNVHRWIDIGPFTIQPSETTKLFMIIFLAKFIDKDIEKINNISVLFSIFIAAIIPIVLIAGQPALSASLAVLVIVLVMIFVAGLSYKYIFALLAVVTPFIIFFFYDLSLGMENHIIIDKFLKPYQLKRLYAWLSPEEYPDLAFQAIQASQALASGQFGGKGLNQGIISQYASYLPYSETDFIFALVGEEFGFVGSFILLVAMLLIVLKCLIIAQKAPNTLGKLIATGVAAMIAFQTLGNACVAIGLLPNTGMPFPFVSYGGSSMWVNMISIGLVLNVGMSKQKSIFEG